MMDKVAQSAFDAGAAQALEDMTKEAGIAEWFAKTNPISRAITGSPLAMGTGSLYGTLLGGTLGGPVGAAAGGIGGAALGGIGSLIQRAIASRAALGRAATGYKTLPFFGDSEAKVLSALAGRKSLWPL
jgi:hypothetical protein